MLVLSVLVVSIGAFLWLLPSGNKSGPLPQPTGTVTPIVNATATSTIPKTGQIISSEVAFEPTGEAEPTPVPTPKSTYSGKCDGNSPYGFTTINADSNLIATYKDMGVCWLRYQTHAYKIIKGGGNYDWSQLDAVVALMNNAGIYLDVPLQCFKGSCFSNPGIPTPEEMTAFARAIAERYNGNSGKGYIAAFECGNEEYDHDKGYLEYGPILAACYDAIKSVHPNAVVGMYGPFPSSPAHTTAVLQTIFNGGYGNKMDFMNFHYYNQGLDPRISVDADHPSFDEKWRILNSVAAQYGFGGKPIWVTEIGWPIRPMSGRAAVSPEVQAEYMVHVTDKAAASGVVRRMFWFTINYGDQENNIYPPKGPLPAYNALKEYVKNKPVW